MSETVLTPINGIDRKMRKKRFTAVLFAGCCLVSITWYFHLSVPDEDMLNSATRDRKQFVRPPQPPTLPKQPVQEKVQPQCTPVKNLSFLKLHRVGSGTFHNVLVRFAINHNAFVGLANCANYQVFPLQVSADLFYPDPQHPQFTGYNMFIDHVLFNKTASDVFLPKDVVYITQIRHPFREAYSVYEHFWAGRPHVDYDLLLSQPERYEAPVDILWPCRRTKNYSISRNVMSLELGYTDQSNTDRDKFEQYLRKLDRELHHVSILEELPQSLMLLRRKLCWEFKDLLQLRKHVTNSGSTNPEVKVQEHKRWSPLDYNLYEFFLRKHKKEVSEQPSWFQEEVEEFVRVQDRFSHFCSHICAVFAGVHYTDTVRIREILSAQIVFPGTRFYKTFSMSYQDCAMLQLGELIVKKSLKFHMNPGVCDSNPELARILQLSCDVSHHVIPGLTSLDINDLLDPRRCENIAYII